MTDSININPSDWLEGGNHCLICTTDDLAGERAIAPCGHDDFCAQCHLRLRKLHDKRSCPICKVENPSLVVDADVLVNDSDTGITLHKAYASYPIWGGTQLGSDYIFREDVGMFFPKQFYEECVVPLFSLHCGVAGCDFINDSDTFVDVEGNNNRKQSTSITATKRRLGGMNALKDHLQKQHNLVLCQLCVDAKRDFVSQLPRFTPNQLKIHQSKGDDEGSGFKGHPLCKFCRPKRFYDITKLHEHLNKEHYKCHVCERQGLHNQFFKNYQQLSVHFDRQHFLCSHLSCLEARFVVFGNELDLKAHEMDVHGSRQTDRKIQISFQYRRSGFDGSGLEQQQQTVPSDADFSYGLDGQAFVPDALPAQLQQLNEPVLSDPVHAARTAELREQAQQIRARMEAEDAFPALQATSASQRLNLGWSNGGPRSNSALATENFPALAAASTARPTTSVSWAAGQQHQRVQPRVNTRRYQPVGYRPVQSSTPRVVATATTSTPTLANQEDFPSLGGTSSAPYRNTIPTSQRTAAAALASSDFPSLGGASIPATSTAQPVPRVTPTPRTTAKPTLSSDTDFPTLGGGGSGSSKKNVLPCAPRYAAAQRYAQQANNTLQPPSPSSLLTSQKPSSNPQQDADSLQLILGKEKYNTLNKLTEEFAAASLSPSAYIEQSTQLFESGDHNMAKYLTQVVKSSKAPQSLADQALTKLGEISRVSLFPSLPLSVVQAPTPSQQYRALAAPLAPKPKAQPKTAWGTKPSAARLAVQPKAPPAATRVAAAAAQQGPQGGTATAYMAKAAKSKSTTKPNYNKQNNQLRNLAFGK